MSHVQPSNKYKLKTQIMTLKDDYEGKVSSKNYRKASYTDHTLKAILLSFQNQQTAI